MRGAPADRRNDSISAFVAALIVTATLAGAALPARAQDDLPGRVGRISEFAGQLYLSPEDRASEWQGIGLNYPVSSGDNLWVGGDGRAEVDYGGGQFRLSGDTNLHVSRLDENQIALFIAQGRVILRVRVLDPGESARIDAPNTQIQLTRPGLYRIDVVPDRQSTAVTVREGEAIVLLANGSQQTLPGQMAIVTGADPVAANVINGTGLDGFDTWSADRDRYYDRPRGNAYVSRQMVGYADLDQYGTWESAPEYGPVWYPANVAPGWAPYQDGYWTSVAGFGLTWVDAAPWGYAPFHYGRWAWVRGRWGWCPGTFVARPVWAPALVGWVGGPGWRVSASFGAPVYGWVPLGWGEPYHPWWGRCSNNCWSRYNRPYAVDVNERPARPPAHFRNADVPGAVAAVSAPTLTGRLMVRDHRVAVPSQQYSSAPVLAAAPAVPAGPLHVPGTRAGTGGTPAPASTYYPVSRAGRLGAETGTRQVTPGAPSVAPPPGQSVTRAAGAPSAPPPGQSMTRAPGASSVAPSPGQPMTRATGSLPPSTTPGAQAPARGRGAPATISPPTALPPANVAPAPSGSATRARPPQPSVSPEYTAVPQPALAAPPNRSDAARQRPVQPPQGVAPAPSVPPAQSMSRQHSGPAVGGALPPPAPRGVPATVAPAVVAPPPHSQGGAPAPHEGNVERGQGRAAEKSRGDPGMPGTPKP